MKISFIATVLNEENNIKEFLHSIVDQSRKVDEIVVVDGESTDATASIISNFIPQTAGQISNKKINFKFLIKKGNRAVGRNEAVRQAKGDIIVCSDAGCIADDNWVKEITKPFKSVETEVVAGYYKGRPASSFERCIVPYFLVMEDKIDPDNFLPATRSIAFRKSIWQKVGGFPEEFSNNEDYVFAKKLRKINAKIVFQKKAIVYWLPKKNFKEAFISFYRFAQGDAQAKIFRPKVIFVFLRYFLAFLLLAFYLTTKSPFSLNILLGLATAYLLWAIIKNYKYVNEQKALSYLPVIQITSDVAVIVGTVMGVFHNKRSS